MSQERIRRLEAMGTLLNLRQGKNESLQSFIEAWKKAEAAYPEPLEENLRTVWFMQCLNGVMKANVFTQEFPSSFNHLMGLAKKAELAVDAGKDDQKVENLGPDRGSKTKKKRSRSNISDENSSRKRRELLCFKCGEPGHMRSRCSRRTAGPHSKLHITTLHHDISK
ncbi:hypothetical protein E4U31_007543 [Claviceps sp. LM219 group G6]|nr:hypothetical protein E4U31_007543 [Claviceps sp. LM219 group G6]KAG6118500.1 hypothetical protein E4U14_006744 [Claviceps sp. LM454 group G7]